MLTTTTHKSSGNKHHDPFGMLLEGRNWEGGSEYRYGFNGMESSNSECDCNQNYSTFYREYNSRIGRWISIDPMPSKEKNISGYAFVNNNSTNLADPNGNCPFCPILLPFIEEMIIAALASGTADYGSQVVGNYVTGQDHPWTNINKNELLISTGTGALTFGATKLITSNSTRIIITSFAIPATESALNQAIEKDWNLSEINIAQVGVDVLVDHAADRALKTMDVSEEIEKIKIAKNAADRANRVYSGNPTNGNKTSLEETASKLNYKERLLSTKISASSAALANSGQKSIEYSERQVQYSFSSTENYLGTKDNQIAPIIDTNDVWKPK